MSQTEMNLMRQNASKCPKQKRPQLDKKYCKIKLGMIESETRREK